MSNREYTDQEMQWGAQLGYLDFLDGDIEEYQDRVDINDYPSLQYVLLNRLINSKLENGNIFNIYCHHKTDVVLYNNSEAMDKYALSWDNIIYPEAGNYRLSEHVETSFTKTDYNNLNEKVEKYRELPHSIEKDLLFFEILNDVNGYTSTFEDRFTLSLLFNMDFINGSLNEFPPSKWKLASVLDNNSESGVYAATIMTNNERAMVCFRGSEREFDFVDDLNGSVNDFVTDWIKSDVGIAMGDLTVQEINAAIYLTTILDSDLFESVATTGHSLGGNLALMAPIIAASMHATDKFVQGCSFDGPGNPDEALNRFSSEIKSLEDRLYHYVFSIVGAFYAETSVAKHNYEIELLKKNNNGFVSSHFLSYVKFDSDGMVIPDIGALNQFDYRDFIRKLSYYFDTNSTLEECVNDSFIRPLVAIAEAAKATTDYWEIGKKGSYIKAVAASRELEREWKKTKTDLGISGGVQSYEVLIKRLFAKNTGNSVDIILSYLFGDDCGAASAATAGSANGSSSSSSSSSSYIIGKNRRYRNQTSKDTGFQNWYLREIESLDDREQYLKALENIDNTYTASVQAVRYNPDPLVLDLDADGVSLLSKQLGVYFDEDAQGLREKTQWISAEDALLAIDLNNNGIIDGGDELFGTSTVLADGSIARNGFEALLQYDSNSDGIIDSRDEIFERLLVWRDQNIDGITDDGELESLVSHGIESISLNAESEETGRRSSVVRYSDDHEARITEVDFEADYYDSRERETIEISDAIKELPNIQAIGNIPSLHSLMQQDESGELTGLVEAFMEAETVDEREAVCTQIIYRISGADAIEAGSRGTEFDAKKLAVIEAFMGRAFVGTAGSNPVNTAASILSGVYDSLFNLYYGLLAKESVLKPYLPLLYMYESDEGERYIDTTYFDFIARFSLENGDDLKNVIPEMARFIAAMNPDNPDNLVDFANKYMDYEGYAEEFSKCRLGITIGTSEGDSISAGNDVDRILAGLGNDVVYGNNGNDDIYGNGGDDTLYGENGDDVLIGGTGDDRLDGGEGSDTYVFNLGDGVDTVYDYEYDMTPQDRILFGEGIDASDVRIERRGNNLVVWYSENDSFTVKDAYRDYYGTGRYFVESIEFSDGTVWETEDIANKANQILGTDENDTLEGFGEAVGYHQNETFRAGTGNDRVYASNGDDILYGEEGEDTLYGESGDDTLVGGEGSDRLEGGEGSDTYVFNLGDGVDTVYDYEYDMTPQNRILFGEGISASDVRIERRGNNLVVWYSENDSFTVKDAYRDYYGTGRYFVESIEFSDGIVWNTEDIANKANQILGTDENDTLEGFNEAVGYHQNETFRAGAGNDRIYASNGDDILYGEEGEDTLYGESGDDTLVGGEGSDRLEGGEGSDTYIFNLGDGVDTVYDYEYDMTPQDRILFGEGISSENVRMERSGNNLVVWYSENDSFTVKDAYRDYYGTGRYFVESIEFSDGTVWDTEDIANMANQILGTDGNDTLEGFSEAVGYHQNETFRGGAGNDRVYASNGDDVLYGEEGDDTLYGESGDDTLIGGEGSDRLEGGEGSDTYVFNLGDGVDTVYDYEYDMTPQDRILFGEGISASDVRIERRGNNLVVWYSENDSFTVKDAYRDYYGTGRYFVESIEFSDGTVWETEDIANKANQILGTDGNDTLEGFSEAVGYHQNETFRGGAGNDRVYASNGDDTIYGEEGDDTLYGESGDDTLVGGEGSDRLEGGEGSDTYVFNLGDGVDTVYDYEYDMAPHDRILFGEGISASDVRIERRGNNLVVWYSENDSFTVKDAYRDYYGTGRYFVESIEFADGTVWNTEDIANKANQILGTDGNDTLEGFSEAVGYHQNETFRAGAGNDRVYASNGDDILYGEEGEDTLYGESGDDTLVGGEGSDRLEGGEGSDTYIFNLGDGVDTVYDYEYDMTPQDRILFGEGIDASNVRIERRGSNLVVWYSENDSFTVKDAYRDYYGTGRYFVESIEFFDGTVWGTEDIANKANKILGTDENDTLEGFNEAVGYHQNETFRAGAGNDRVYASNGDDTIYGEDGDDTLYGEDGADILVGGAGKDRLDGGVGNDTYVFNKGDGIDTIFDYEYSDTSGKEDRILFGSGISIEDISLERTGNNLVIKYGETDQVTIDSAYRDYYGIGKYQIEQVEFEDGTKTIIDYDKESLVVTYQPEPVEEPVQTETEETPVSEETVDVPVQEEIVTGEISLSENDIAAETEEVFELDEVVAAVEEVLNTDIVETDQEFELSEEPDVLIADYIDIEMEQATNLLVQEMSASIEGNISELLTEEQPILIADELLWTE